MNLHIFLSSIESETRLFKETQFTLKGKIFSRVGVCGLWKEGKSEYEKLDWGLEVYRKKTYLSQCRTQELLSKPKLARLILAGLSLLQYMLFVVRKALSLRPTHVTCHNCLLLPLSWLATLLVRAKLIYAPHELETERTHLHGFQKIVEKIIERLFIKFCSAVVVVCDPIAEWYKEHYQLDNVSVIRNLPKNKDLIVFDDPRFDFREIFKIPSESIVFIYQGIVGPARGTSQLLDIFSNEKFRDVHLVFMGLGEDSCIEEIIEFQRKHSNIHFHPAVPMNEIISYTASADVGIFVSNVTSLSYEYALPNKFFEYLHGGLPVIVSKNLSYLSTTITSNGLGWATSLDDLEAAILEISQVAIQAATGNVRYFSRSAVWEADAEQYRGVYCHAVD